MRKTCWRLRRLQRTDIWENCTWSDDRLSLFWAYFRGGSTFSWSPMAGCVSSCDLYGYRKPSPLVGKRDGRGVLASVFGCEWEGPTSLFPQKSLRSRQMGLWSLAYSGLPLSQGSVMTASGFIPGLQSKPWPWLPGQTLGDVHIPVLCLSCLKHGIIIEFTHRQL